MDTARERPSLRSACCRPRAAAQWPPEGAEPLELDYLYDVLAEHGLEYGPAFQGLRAAWREGERIYVEATLAEEQAGRGAELRHPPGAVRLRPARHRPGGQRGSGQLKLPFSWSGVSPHAEGPRELRVTPRRAREGEVSLELADASGAPLASIRSLALRALDPSQLQGAGHGKQGLLGIQWAEVPLPEQDGRPPRSSSLRPEIDGEGRRGRARGRRAAPWRRSRHGSPTRPRPPPAWPSHQRRDGRRGGGVTRPRRRGDLGPGPLGPIRAPRPLRPDRHRRHRCLRGGPPRRARARRRGAPARPARGQGAGAAGNAAGEHGGLAGAAAGPLAAGRAQARHPREPRAPPNPGRTSPSARPRCGSQMRAAGLNFRDVLAALGYRTRAGRCSAARAPVWSSRSAPRSSDLAPGDRVMGMVPDAFGPLAVGERDRLRADARGLVLRAGAPRSRSSSPPPTTGCATSPS